MYASPLLSWYAWLPLNLPEFVLSPWGSGNLALTSSGHFGLGSYLNPILNILSLRFCILCSFYVEGFGSLSVCFFIWWVYLWLHILSALYQHYSDNFSCSSFFLVVLHICVYVYIYILLLWKSLICVWLCNPMDCRVHGLLQATILVYVAVPFSRDLPNPGIVPMSPTLQADSLPAGPPGKPIYIHIHTYMYIHIYTYMVVVV